MKKIIATLTLLATIWTPSLSTMINNADIFFKNTKILYSVLSPEEAYATTREEKYRSKKTWGEICDEGVSPVGSLVDAKFTKVNDKWHYSEGYHPPEGTPPGAKLVKLPGSAPDGSFYMDQIKEVPGKESQMKIYKLSSDESDYLYKVFWNDHIVLEFHFNRYNGGSYFGCRGTFQPDGNLEQVWNKGTQPDFWHKWEYFFPEVAKKMGKPKKDWNYKNRTHIKR